MTPAQQLIQLFLPSGGSGSLNRDYKAPHANRPTPERKHFQKDKEKRAQAKKDYLHRVKFTNECGPDGQVWQHPRHIHPRRFRK